MVTVLYSTERPGGRWERESFVIGPSAAGHAFHRPSGTLAPAIWPVRRMRLEGLAGDAYDGSQAQGNIRWQDGHTKKT